MVSSTSSNPWNVTASTIDLEEVDLETPEADGASAASPTGSPKAAPKSSKSLGTLALDASASASVSSKRDSTMSAASEASAASRASVAPSDVTFEEVGFDDAEAWTEGPGARLDRDLALDLGLATPSGSPVKHLASIPAINTGSASASVSPSSSRPGLPRSGSGTPTSSGRRSSASPGASSPAASERTVLGGMLRESVSSATSAYSSYSAFSGYTAGSGGTGVAAGAGLGLSVREGDIPLVLGVAVVDFNHLIGPTVEFAHPQPLADAIAADDELARLLPFLALPDGAHLSEEDYSYFHCIYTPRAGTPKNEIPTHRTLFGISCNRQIAASELLRRRSDVTRSMVQKAVVVLASQPVFGPVRDRLGVVTRAFFAQRDFDSTQILQDFYESLNAGLQGKAGEGAIYMGTNLRELVHKFRHRTLVLLKMILLQKRIMLFGYPVEMLCTYQYTLVSLVPGLLMALKDCGAPGLDLSKQRVRPTSLRTSDRASLLRYMGLPLHLFGMDSVFQPYLPLQQMDMLQAHSWLVGTTNQIVTQQKDCKYDLLVNIEHVAFEFSDPKIERLVNLTSADRMWMDDMVRAVDETWSLSEGERPGFLGSDDDLRNRFEEYICAFLASLKYSDFLSQGGRGAAMGAGGEANPLIPFGEAFAASFRVTPACSAWDEMTDPVIFDLSEPRHPCDGKVNAVADISIRLTEGLHDLRIEESLAPTREALSSAFAAGSTSLLTTFNSMREGVNNRIESERQRRAAVAGAAPPSQPLLSPNAAATPAAAPAVSPIGGAFASVGSFFGSRFAKTPPPPPNSFTPKGLRPMSLKASPASSRRNSTKTASSGNGSPPKAGAL